MNLLITFVNGLSLGGIYAMIALGYTMVYGIAKMLNFAHGDIIMVGGYTILLFLSVNPIAAIIASVIFCMAVGIVIEKVAYKPLRGASPLAVLITAIGVSYLLQSIAQMIFGSAPKFVVIANLGTLKFGELAIGYNTIITLACSVVVMIVLNLFVKFSKTGRAMVAVSEDKGAAQLMGINVNSIIMITFAIGSALASLASLFFLLKAPTINPTFGSLPGIKAFTAAVIGGIGSIPGAMVGGLLLGVIECFAQSVPAVSPYTDAIEFSILIILLLVKPTGLLGKKRREKV
ncbi:MAG: branched-chain amino acid ABC transporter permease [Ruminococcaceae bacterium]|nr:branched-chain amino acid ABC transporter permease [Oscillospiraceae bacterium]